MSRFVTWLDHRTGVRRFVHEALFEHIPGGPRWRYVWGSTLVFAFVVQMITGVFLAMAYSPSSQTAWESVYFIQHHMTLGWLLRGIHHFMAQAMVVLLGLHLLQVVIDGAYKAPREVNFWLGLILMQIVLGLSLTGYLLPWDQKGYWATNVATNLMTLVPVIGADLQRLVVGGSDYGHHTLTRFFALHVMVLPGLLILVLVAHLALFRRHGVTPAKPMLKRDGYFWPHQVLKDALASLAVLALVIVAVFVVGAELGAPADPSEQYSAARPEWYFLFLFQLLKYVPSEFIGAIVLPGLVMLMLFLMPFFGRSAAGHRFNVAVVVLVLLAAGALTGLALYDDANDKSYQIAKKEAHAEAERMVALIERPDPTDHARIEQQGLTDQQPQPMMIPAEGALSLLRGDPLAQGPKLFRRHCASCHDWAPADEETDLGHGLEPIVTARYQAMRPRADGSEAAFDTTPSGGANLYGFGSEAWLRGLLNPHLVAKIEYGEVDEEKKQRPIQSAPYFGNTAHRDGRMAEWVKKEILPPTGTRHAGLRKPTTVPGVRDLQKLLVTAIAEKTGLKKSLGSLEITDVKKRLNAAEENIPPPVADLGLRAAEMVRLPEIEFQLPPEKTEGDTDEKHASATEDWEEAQTEKIEDYVAALIGVAQLDDIIAAVAARGKLRGEPEYEQSRLDHGWKLAQETCARSCHKVGEVGEVGLAPELTDYGSYQWTMGLVSDVEHVRFYGDRNDRMPIFTQHLGAPEKNLASAHEISLIVDWLRGEYYQQQVGRPDPSHSAVQAEDAIAGARQITLPALTRPAADPAAQPKLAQAEKLFQTKCASCHSHVDQFGHGIVAKRPSAPNLHEFAGKDWLAGILDAERITNLHYFGKVNTSGEMIDFVESDLEEPDDDFQKLRDKIIDALAAGPANSPEVVSKRAEALTTTFDSYACTDCHQYHGEGFLGSAPDLTGYGSRDWVAGMIATPGHGSFYGEYNDGMPHFIRRAAKVRCGETGETYSLASLRGRRMAVGEKSALILVEVDEDEDLETAAETIAERAVEFFGVDDAEALVSQSPVVTPLYLTDFSQALAPGATKAGTLSAPPELNAQEKFNLLSRDEVHLLSDYIRGKLAE